MTGTEHLLLERRGAVLVCTLNRPEARNALSLEMLARMADAWDESDRDPSIRVVVLTGAAGCFCAGADLKMMHTDQSGDPWQARYQENPKLHWRALMRDSRPLKPMIAAVEGFAVGGGTELLQGTDIRIAGESATFGLSEVKWGLFPLGGSTVRLRRQIPYAKAMDLLLTGRLFKAPEAERIGLLTRVVPDGTALDEAMKVAELIAANGPLAVQAVKRSVIETEGLPEAEALARELEIGWPILATEDGKEGPRAFQEKRKPNFVGR